MFASSQEPESLEQLSEIASGQDSALGKHEQALAALFTELQSVSENITDIQALLQPQPTPSNEPSSSTVSETSQAVHAETTLPALQPYAWGVQSLHYEVLSYI